MIYAYRVWYRCYNSIEKVNRLIGNLKSGKADEAILFTEDYCTDRAFLPLEEFIRRSGWIREIKPLFEKSKITVSINVLNTIGHVDSLDSTGESLKLSKLVGHDGVQAKACICPVDKVTRSYILNKYRIFAKIKPRIIWIDDDFRWNNHPPVKFGCFCGNHINKFNKKFGYKFDRSGLVSEILKDTDYKPNCVKRNWTGFQGNVLKKLFMDIAKVVYRASPSTAIGLMLPEFDHICSYSGLDLKDLLKSISKTDMKMVTRPGGGFWNDLTPSSIILKVEDIAKRNYTMGRGIRAYSEIENYPYSFYQKSCKVLEMEMELNIAAGDNTDFAFNLFDSHGNPWNVRKKWLETSSGVKKRLSKITEICRYTERKGVLQAFSKKYFSNCIHPNKSLEDGFPPYSEEPVLWSLGIPEGLYGPGPCILRDQIVLAMNRKQIISILSKGAVIDGDSAYLLCKKGYGILLGLDIKNRVSKPVNEYLTEHELNKGYSGSGYSIRRETIRPYFIKLKGASPLSEFVDLDGGKTSWGITCFENKYGGRVATYPYALSARMVTSLIPQPVSLLNFPGRKAQFVNLLTWINRSPLLCRADAEGRVYIIYRESKDGREIFAGIYNFSYDTIMPVNIFMKRLIDSSYKIYRLSKQGDLVSDKGIKQEKGMVRITNMSGFGSALLFLRKKI